MYWRPVQQPQLSQAGRQPRAAWHQPLVLMELLKLRAHLWDIAHDALVGAQQASEGLVHRSLLGE